MDVGNCRSGLPDTDRLLYQLIGRDGKMRRHAGGVDRAGQSGGEDTLFHIPPLAVAEKRTCTTGPRKQDRVSRKDIPLLPRSSILVPQAMLF